MEQSQLGRGGQGQIQAAGVGKRLTILLDADGIAGERQGHIMPVGETQASCF